MRPRSLALPIVAAILVGGVALTLGHSRASSNGAATAAVSPAKVVHLTIANYAYAPPSLTVKAGTAVIVKNTDSTQHTATARSGAFDSGTLQPGASGRFVLGKPGTYTYYCQFHAFMSGTITVVR